ncbi:histamine H2 receptor-like [Clytia hemisphaerica]|uniref:G-protein coupled receptors family 1 profile domain-containing protein n=1 Tax=Clytia hemisphaerica TaxID=252671 RepID=A0A7M5X6R1_9CNID
MERLGSSTNITHLINTINTTAITAFANHSKNNTFQKRGPKPFDPTPGNITELVVLAVLCVLILLGNALVILAFIKGPRSIRTYTNYFVVNLAICDFMVGCLSVPYWMCVRLQVVGPEISHYFISLDVLFGTASILSLVAISIERMAAVRHPTHHYNMSSRPVFAAIFLTWFIGFILFGIKIWIGLTRMEEYTISIFIVSFALPLAIIVFSYIVLFKSAYSLQRADNQTRAQSIHRDMQIAKTISIIVGLFVLCWAPFFGMNLLFIVCMRCLSIQDFVLLVSIAKVMHYSNSMMNFFVYAVRSPEFKRTFKVLLSFECTTDNLRHKIRTVSGLTRLRGASILLKRNNNNAESCADMEKSPSMNNHGRNEEKPALEANEKSFLMVPKANGKSASTDSTGLSSSANSDTMLTDLHDSSYTYPYP